jgi:hypothetical protein
MHSFIHLAVSASSQHPFQWFSFGRSEPTVLLMHCISFFGCSYFAVERQRARGLYLWEEVLYLREYE